MQGGAKVGLQLFIWKYTIINNNIQINSVFHVLTTVNLFLSHIYPKILNAGQREKI